MKKYLFLFLFLFPLCSYATLTPTKIPVTKIGGSTPQLQDGSITDTGTPSASGNVGVGSPTPGATLDVAGTIRGTTITGNISVGPSQTTLNCSTATQSQIQSSLTAMGTSTYGGTVQLSGSGLIGISTTPLTIGNNTILKGDGNGGCTLQAETNIDILNDVAGGASNFEIRDLNFDGNNTVLTQQWSDIRIFNNSTRFRILNNNLYNSRTHGTWVQNGTWFTIIGNHYWNNGYTGLVGNANITLHTSHTNGYAVNHGDVIGNNIQGFTGKCIHVKDSASDILIANNICDTAGEEGILLGATANSDQSFTTPSHDITVIGNRFTNCGNINPVSGQDGCISEFGSYNDLVEGNYANTGSTFLFNFVEGHDNKIKNNYAINGGSGVASSGLAINDEQNDEVTGNVVGEVNASLIDISNYSSGTHVSNNYLWNGKSGLQVRQGAINTVVENNYLVNTRSPNGYNFTSSGINLQANTPGTVVRDNFVYNFSTPSSENLTPSTVPIDAEGWTRTTGAIITGDANTFTGTTGDSVAVTIDSTLHDNISIGTATSIQGVCNAINAIVQYSCIVTENGYIQLRSLTVGSGSNITIADGSTTSQTVIAKLFSVVGDRTGIGKIGYKTYFNTQDFIGNVGIGTFLPGNQMSINGSLGIGTSNSTTYVNTKVAPSGSLIVQNNVGIGTFQPQSPLAIGSTGQFQVSSSGGITDSGNVGISTSIPNPIHVQITNGVVTTWN